MIGSGEPIIAGQIWCVSLPSEFCLPAAPLGPRPFHVV